MKFSLTPKFKPETIRKFLLAKKEKIEKALFSRLQMIGEQFIADARNFGDYKDQTGNLRSSVGYVIVRHGSIVFKSFPGAEKIGREKAKEHIDRLLQEGNIPRQGFALIGVAGMDYAAAVESKGRDVITGSSQKAIENLRRAIAEISKKI